MTPKQQKELDALNEALRAINKIDNELGYPVWETIEIEIQVVRNYLEKIKHQYADHFAEIQALKSGEWVLVPSEPTDKQLDVVYNFINEHLDWSKQPNETAKDGYVYHLCKAMIAARQKLKEIVPTMFVIGDYPPDPFATYSHSELKRIEGDKNADYKMRRAARKERIRRLESAEKMIKECEE